MMKVTRRVEPITVVTLVDGVVAGVPPAVGVRVTVMAVGEMVPVGKLAPVKVMMVVMPGWPEVGEMVDRVIGVGVWAGRSRVDRARRYAAFRRRGGTPRDYATIGAGIHAFLRSSGAKSSAGPRSSRVAGLGGGYGGVGGGDDGEVGAGLKGWVRMRGGWWP